MICAFPILLACLSLLLLPPAHAMGQETNHLLRLVIIGDSTVCNYPTNGNQRGWGQYLQDYFTEDVRVINLAKSGRSTKTFIMEGLWQKALAEKPEVVLIQFGHNDSHSPDKPEATDARTDYRVYLRRYIDDARAIHSTPILITPMVRRDFGRDVFDVIKIDRSFVSELGKRDDSVVIVRAIISLAKALGIATVAEGVESKNQFACLRAEGCRSRKFDQPSDAGRGRCWRSWVATEGPGGSRGRGANRGRRAC